MASTVNGFAQSLEAVAEAGEEKPEEVHSLREEPQAAPDFRDAVSPSHKRYASYAASDRQPHPSFKECRSASELRSVEQAADSLDHRRTNCHNSSSIDPITRDVERRMSMKDHHSTVSSSA